MRQRVFTGVVTQLQDRHGMVDQEVRFAMSAVVGRVPLVGDKVLVKAVQDPSQSVKWTAQRVQVLNGKPFNSPPPLLHSTSPNMNPAILGNKRQPLLKSPKIPPLIPGMQPNPGGMLQMPHHQNMPWTAPFEAWGGGSRKRHNEGVAGRRGRHWEESGASWAGDNMHQKRRRWKAPSEEETTKSAPTASLSPTLFSFFSRDSQACDNLELQRRYPHLHAPPSLFHIQLCWPESFPPNQPLPLAGPCQYHISSRQPQKETPTSESSVSTDSSFSVKVMLLSVAAIEDFYSQCCNYAEDGKSNKDAVHPSTLFKFLLLEKAGELQLPGGMWSPTKDGLNPGKDSNVLINTAIRCVKDQTDLDLAACTQWHKMAELRLLCEDKVETVVILLPDVWNLMQTTEEWARLKEEWKNEESPLPDAPSLVVQPTAGFTLSVLSLSSLLEPRNSSTSDRFEVGLASELFSEMLQRDFGLQLYHTLCSLPQAPSVLKDSGSASTDELKQTDKETVKKGVSNSKGTKKEDGETTTLKQEECERTNDQESESQAEGEEDKPSLKNNNQQCIELPRRVLLSWVFFDRQLSGHLREEDMQNILLSLGLYLSASQVQDLVRKISDGGKCMYRKICSRWTDAEEVACDLTAEGNKVWLPSTPRKDKSTSRRSASSTNTDVVTYKGTVLNIPNLLQSLGSSKAAQHDMERRIAELQDMLEGAKAKPVSDEQEQLKSRLERVEALNKTYEKSLKENAGHMLSVIEKMQKMVDQTTSLTRTKELKD